MRGPASPVRVRPPLPMPGSALATSVPTPLPRAGNAGSAPAAAFSATWGGGIDVGGAPPRLRSATRAPLAHAGGVWERLSPEGVSLPLFLLPGTHRLRQLLPHSLLFTLASPRGHCGNLHTISHDYMAATCILRSHGYTEGAQGVLGCPLGSTVLLGASAC